jgi:MerR family transcriptional regulator, copper efflux regulator
MTRTLIRRDEELDRNRNYSQLLKIGEVFKQTGIGIETLRFYEKSGLLDRPLRTQSGYRLYSADVVERLEFIKRAQTLGFSLEEIKRIVEERKAGQSPCAEVREIVRHKLKELDERMEMLKRYRKELARALSEWDKAGDVKGHVCGLIEGTNLEQNIKQKGVAGRKHNNKR